jgi:uncharacterized protein YbjQ (UPF0145 family)
MQNISFNFVEERNFMILTNIETIPGQTIAEHYGMVSGSSVRAKHFGRDFVAGVKNMFGGEIEEYTELMNEARKEATKRMVLAAMQMGANAIVNVRYATSAITAGAAEVYAYGTAVKVQGGNLDIGEGVK